MSICSEWHLYRESSVRFNRYDSRHDQRTRHADGGIVSVSALSSRRGHGGMAGVGRTTATAGAAAGLGGAPCVFHSGMNHHVQQQQQQQQGGLGFKEILLWEKQQQQTGGLDRRRSLHVLSQVGLARKCRVPAYPHHARGRHHHHHHHHHGSPRLVSPKLSPKLSAKLSPRKSPKTGRLVGRGRKAAGCFMCLGGFNTQSDEQEVRELPCRHKFHLACLHQWLLERDGCQAYPGIPGCPACYDAVNTRDGSNDSGGGGGHCTPTPSATVASDVVQTTSRITGGGGGGGGDAGGGGGRGGGGDGGGGGASRPRSDSTVSGSGLSSTMSVRSTIDMNIPRAAFLDVGTALFRRDTQGFRPATVTPTSSTCTFSSASSDSGSVSVSVNSVCSGDGTGARAGGGVCASPERHHATTSSDRRLSPPHFSPTAVVRVLLPSLSQPFNQMYIQAVASLGAASMTSVTTVDGYDDDDDDVDDGMVVSDVEGRGSLNIHDNDDVGGDSDGEDESANNSCEDDDASHDHGHDNNDVSEESDDDDEYGFVTHDGYVYDRCGAPLPPWLGGYMWPQY